MTLPSSPMRYDFSLRIAVLLLSGLLASCAVLAPDLYGRKEFKHWMRQALLHPKRDAGNYRFYLAYNGNALGLHAYFLFAQEQANNSEVNLMGDEALAYELETLVRHLGDKPFADALSHEPPEIQSAVACFLYQPGLSRYPQTLHLLQSAPKIDFPMLRAYRTPGAGGAQ